MVLKSEVAHGLRLPYLLLIVVLSKGQGHAHLTENITEMVTDSETLLLQCNWKSHMVFRLAYI